MAGEGGICGGLDFTFGPGERVFPVFCMFLILAILSHKQKAGYIIPLETKKITGPVKCMSRASFIFKTYLKQAQNDKLRVDSTKRQKNPTHSLYKDYAFGQPCHPYTLFWNH